MPFWGHPLNLRSLSVTPQAILDSGLEVEADDPKSDLLGGSNVDLTLRRGGIGIVHDERLECLDARPQKATFPVPGLEHVQAEADVGVEEAFPVERRFPGPLQPDEDHGFHDAAPSQEARRKVTIDPTGHEASSIGQEFGQFASQDAPISRRSADP